MVYVIGSFSTLDVKLVLILLNEKKAIFYEKNTLYIVTLIGETMANLAVTLGNAVIKSTPKVARRAKYLMQEVTPSVSTFEHTVTATVNKVKYQQPPTSEVTAGMIEWLQNSSVTRRIIKMYPYHNL